MIKVVKFGGSSVASAEQFAKVKKIIEADDDRKFIITSACGRINKEDYKVTDLLYLIEAHIRYGVSYDQLFQLVKDKYYSIAKALGLKTDLDKEFVSIEKLIERHETTDYLVSRGEYLAAKLLAEYLEAQFVDARDVIAFRYDGSIDMERTEELLKDRCEKGRRIVIPGFYGALPNGAIRVMSRGGSDITGSIVASAVNADVYENWTDVSGFMVADPRIIEKPLRIPCITYAELREMSYMGANVLHDDAVFPVRKKNIPINIRNTNDPDNPGTMITDDCEEFDKKYPPHAITGVTGRRNFTIITLIKAHSSTEVGFLRKILSIFEKYNVSIEQVPISVDTFSVIVESNYVSACLYDIVGDLKKELVPDELRIEEHISLIAMVGREMRNRPGMSGALLSECGRNHINIRTISQSSHELSVIIGVNDADFEKAIQAIYDTFIMEEKKGR